jgi:hypothetical protein
MKPTLKHIYPKDVRAMSLLAKAGAISKETFHKLDISNNRINSYEKMGFVKEVHIPTMHGPGCKSYYELQPKGKEFCERECNIKHFISNGGATTHNAKVSEYLVEHLNKGELDTVMSERELSSFIEDRLQEYYDRNDERYEQLLDGLKTHSLSMPDIIYKTQEGTFVAIEVITNSYGQDEIDCKLETCHLLDVEVTLVHT